MTLNPYEIEDVGDVTVNIAETFMAFVAYQSLSERVGLIIDTATGALTASAKWFAQIF